jgi:hypothetical protein
MTPAREASYPNIGLLMRRKREFSDDSLKRCGQIQNQTLLIELT